VVTQHIFRQLIQIPQLVLFLCTITAIIFIGRLSVEVIVRVRVAGSIIARTMSAASP
jgi:hypothetical protein